jgi:uncharacterized paraquat-inducible protein A
MFGIDHTMLPAIISLVFIIMTICVPFFIFRIRNESIKTNQLLAQLVQALAPDSAPDKYKTCPACHAKNRHQDTACLQCGRAI